MRWTIPNILTVVRLIAAPAVLIVFALLSRPLADWVALILFTVASFTDYLDGYLARRMNWTSAFGRMLDPIADKAMVVIALVVVVALFGLSPWVTVPAAFILLREVFVSGLREFLGDNANKLQVTRLAKWKTALQMIAIALLFGQGLFEHYYGMGVFGMSPQIVNEILSGAEEDITNLRFKYYGMVYFLYAGVGLLWIAAILTVISGIDYLRKSLPYLAEPK